MGFEDKVNNLWGDLFDVTFASLIHLTSIGLIEFNHVTNFSLAQEKLEIEPTYFHKSHRLKAADGQQRLLSLGRVVFMTPGSELATICGAQSNDEFEKAALEAWVREGWKEEVRIVATTDDHASPASS
jgi:hypothetical protein